MKLKTYFGKPVKLPVIGSISLKEIVRWGVIGLLFGVVVFLAVRIPKVGPFIAEALDRVRRYTPSNQL